MLFQGDAMISIWTRRKTVASVKPDRKVEVTIGTDGGGKIFMNIEVEELSVCLCVGEFCGPSPTVVQL